MLFRIVNVNKKVNRRRVIFNFACPAGIDPLFLCCCAGKVGGAPKGVGVNVALAVAVGVRLENGNP
jgi:hypothetical protein